MTNDPMNINDFDSKKLGKYFSAISNEANQ